MNNKFQQEDFKNELRSLCNKLEDAYRNAVILNECKARESEEAIYYIIPLTNTLHFSLDHINARLEKLSASCTEMY